MNKAEFIWAAGDVEWHSDAPPKHDGTVNLAFNPSEARVTSGTGGGQWTAGSTQGSAPPKGVPNNPTRIAALQRQLGLKDTGVWNAQTRAALLSYAAAHGISINAVAGALGKADVTKFGGKAGGKKGGKGRKGGGKGRHSGTGRHRAAGTGRHRSTTGRHRSSSGHRSSTGRHRSSTGRHRAGRAAQGNSPQSAALAKQVAHALARLGAQPKAPKSAAPKAPKSRVPRASTPRSPGTRSPGGHSTLRQQVHAALRASKRPSFQRQAAAGKIPTRHH